MDPQQPHANQKQRLQELIEVCRAGSQDLDEPELAELAGELERDQQLREQFEAARQWDRWLMRSLHDLPVPPGLAERLATAALAVSAEAETMQAPAAESEENLVTVAPRPAPRTGRRARWIGLSSIIAAAAIVLVAFLIWPREAEPLSAEQWARIVYDDWLAAIQDEQWKTEELTEIQEKYRIDPSIDFRPERWQFVGGIGQRAVVYLMTVPPDHSQAYLFVVRTKEGQQLPPRPSQQPDSASHLRDWSIGVWKRGAHVYALAVEGDKRQYQLLVPPPSQVAGRKARRVETPGAAKRSARVS